MFLSTCILDVVDLFSANNDELTFGVATGDIVTYEFSGNWPGTTSYVNITFVFTEVSSSTVSATAHLSLKNGTIFDRTVDWNPNSPIFYYEWWRGFQIFIPLGFTVGNKIGSVVEYSEQFTSFDLFINGTAKSEWFDCTRAIIYMQRRWAFQDWVRTVFAEYDGLYGIAYGLYESIELENELYTLSLTMISTTCSLSGFPLSISDIRYSPQKPTPDEEVSVTVEIEHPCYGVKSIHLLYSTDDGVSWTSKSIDRSIIYTTKIPQQEEGSVVQFKVQAEDYAGNVVETGVISYVVQAAEPTPLIPGFPLESIIIGIVATIFIMLLLRKQISYFPDSVLRA